jgi:hypothetical protein
MGSPTAIADLPQRHGTSGAREYRPRGSSRVGLTLSPSPARLPQRSEPDAGNRRGLRGGARRRRGVAPRPGGPPARRGDPEDLGQDDVGEGDGFVVGDQPGEVLDLPAPGVAATEPAEACLDDDGSARRIDDRADIYRRWQVAGLAAFPRSGGASFRLDEHAGVGIDQARLGGGKPRSSTVRSCTSPSHGRGDRSAAGRGPAVVLRKCGDGRMG